MPDAGAAQTVLTSRDGPIVTVTLNRPDRLNALDAATWRLLADTIEALSAEDDLRCIVIRGAGGNFAAGADIQSFERERAGSEQARAYATHMQRALRAVAEGRHPTVALIQGVCVGGGLELATVCDIRVCGTSSRFGVPIKKLGHTMSYGELVPLVALVGPAAAKEILLEGEVFGAERALGFGLVNRVVADAEVEGEAFATATRIAEGAPLAARWHRKFIRRLLDGQPLTRAEIDEGYASTDTEDYKIGVRAFLEKKRPKFVGR
ncbi:MAG: enoyl-CoA hydratase/isomerase family protein [Alphaproteobacteria bacterium]|nr:enoyl-CoA hydratase/isomerase family protein [Alphaproteobacteria bacterium]